MMKITVSGKTVALAAWVISGIGPFALAITPLSINDASFETGPALIPYATTISNQWQETWVNGNAAGEVLVTSGMFTDPVPDGTNCLWINNNYAVFQGLADNVSAGTYTFSVWIGERMDLGSVGWAPAIGQFDLLAANGTSLAAATLLAPTTFVNNPVLPGQWVQSTKTYTIAVGDPRIGKPLVIEFTNPQAGQYEATLDKPVLTFQSIPEPATMVLAMLGGSGLMLALRRRR